MPEVSVGVGRGHLFAGVKMLEPSVVSNTVHPWVHE